MANNTPTGGDDVLFGTDFDDTIDALGGNDWIQSGAGSDTLDGNTGNDALWAGSNYEADRMTGGQGSDTYHYDDIGDTIIEGGAPLDGKADKIMSYYIGTADMSVISANVENLRIVGYLAGRDAEGNDLDNTLEGNRQFNSIGGGNGDDVIIVHDTLDIADGEADTGAGGGDTVLADFTCNLATTANWINIENITLGGKSAISATGDANNNTITGNDAKNTLTGGDGDDTFVVQDTLDVVIETNLLAGGIDTISAKVSYSIAKLLSVENITLTDTASVNATGNIGDNILTGNDGNNILDGAAGVDTLIGGKGSDTFIVDNLGDLVTENSGEGTDTVKSSVSFDFTDANNASNELENLTLTGTLNINGTGNIDNNTIIGNTGINTLTGNGGQDYLDGGGGADRMIGDTGDDTYIVNLYTDIAEDTGNGGGGIDRINATFTTTSMYTMADGIEIMTLLGTVACNVTGNISDNTITGNTAANIIFGGDGLDIINAGNGNNAVHGGNDNDTITAGSGTDNLSGDAGGDTITAGAGNDVINGGDDVDTLNGGSGNDVITGGDGGGAYDIMHGDDGNDTLIGGFSTDFLDGGGGTDRMIGGTGDDTYGYDNKGDVIIELPGEGTDTVASFLDYTLIEPTATFEVENIDLDPVTPGGVHGTAHIAIGNSHDNYIYGNAQNNTLSGGGGSDTLQESSNPGGRGGQDTYDGGTGADFMDAGDANDVYFVDNFFDIVQEAAGIAEGKNDLIYSTVTYDMSISTIGEVESLTLLGSANIDGTGNIFDNTITGNAGINVLAGGLGVDTFVVGAGDTVLENNGEGTLDTIMSSITWVLHDDLDGLHEVEGLTLTGTANINGTGNELGNRLQGNAGVNILAGSTGDDTYVIDDANDVALDTLRELTGEGNDTVEASISYTLAPSTPTREIENITLVTTANINATGNDLNNTLTGNDGSNTLDGSTGDDVMIGGKGGDTYIADALTDTVTENPGEGTDTVIFTSPNAGDTWILSATTENLTLGGTAAINGTGTAGVNTIIGNGAANVIDALGGNDTIDGGGGADDMTGGLGNDVFMVDNVGDVVNENAGEGTDRILANIGAGLTYVMGSDVEELTLTGSAGSNATGNAQDDTIVGNSAVNTLSGGDGSDIMVATAGDVILENNGEGSTDAVKTDVSWVLHDNLDGLHEVENVTLTGSLAINATGNELNNGLTGNTGINTLDGSAGADSMEGMGGNDVYVVDDTADVCDETTGGGIDLVLASVDYDMSVETNGAVDNLTLLGAALNGTGNSFGNVITGNAGVNVLIGNDGNDTLIGGTGADTMDGGDGNDTFYVDNLGDIVIDTNPAVDPNTTDTRDTVNSSVSYIDWDPANNHIEIINLTGTANINAVGDDGVNTITGNAGVNTLDGGNGDDTLAGSNTDFLFGNADDGGGDTAMVSFSVNLAAQNAGPFWESIENIILTGKGLLLNAIGDSGVNTITGNDSVNTLEGGGGTDTLIGHGGNDVYIVRDSTVVVDEQHSGGGVDQVLSYVDYDMSPLVSDAVEKLTLIGPLALVGTGNNSANTIVGNQYDNTIDGGLGADSMDGGAGNDIFSVDNTGDVIKDASGVDLVISTLGIYTLGTGLENLTLGGTADINGTGNTLVNTITGNIGKNILDGGTGVDWLIGGDGDDTYVIDSSSEQGLDHIQEFAGEGTDTVNAKISFSIENFGSLHGYEVENLTLLGTGSLNGTGNEDNNVIRGNTGANTLHGGAGDDTLIGDLGKDVLYGDAGHDVFYFNGASVATGTNPDIIKDYDVLEDSIFVEVSINPLTQVYEDFVDYRVVGTNTQIWVDFDAEGTAYTPKLVATVENAIILNN